MPEDSGKRGYETVDVQGLERSSTEMDRLEGSPRLPSAPTSTRETTERRGFYAVVVVLLFAMLISMPADPLTPEDLPPLPPARKNFCDVPDPQWSLATDVPPPPPAPPPIFFSNCKIWTGGDAGTLEGASLLVSGGKIAAIGGSAPADAEHVDCRGAWMTPGIIDIHSHLGVNSYPGDWNANNDGNEIEASGHDMGGIMNMVRALDGLDPEDPAIQQIRSGGVTTSQVLPGSANMMGGESMVIKMTGGPDCPFCTTESMVVREFRGLKMACGENPKRAGKVADAFWPSTRMGAAYKMRAQFLAAKKLMQAQDDWDEACATGIPQAARRPVDLSLDSLVALLRGEAKLHNHCYQVHDMTMMIRLSHEFGFKIAAFHHALEAYKLLPTMAAEGIAAATWPDDWVGKAEGYDTSFHTPAWTVERGVLLVLKSDHPVTDAKGLMYAAARAVHYGLSVEDALKSMTINAAITLGLDHRIGKLETGFDADLVLWDRHPLSLGAATRAVYIEGTLAHTGAPAAVMPPPFGPPQLDANHAAFTLTGPCDTTTEGGLVTLATYSVTANTIWTMDSGYQSIVRSNGIVVVENGIITCVGTSSSCAGDLLQIPQSARFTTNGEMWAGMVAAGNGIGMYEMGEAPTHDGTARGTDDDMLDLWAVDGMRTGGRHQWEAFRGALTVSVTPPEGSGRLVTGVSGAWWVTPKSVGWDQAVLKKAVALHMTLGNAAKGAGMTGSVSGQLLLIRKMLTREIPHTGHTSTLEAVINGTWPLVMHVHQADAIDALLRLLDEVAPAVRLTIFGGAEAHLIAGKLAAARVPVVLSPPRAVPRAAFDQDRAVGGEESAAEKLNAAGVLVGLAGAAGPPTNLRWEAGLAVCAGMPRDAAMRSVTTNVALAFGLPDNIGRIAVGQRAHFAVYSSDPLATDSEVMLVAIGDTLSCKPPATPWDIPWAPTDPYARPAGVDWTHLASTFHVGKRHTSKEFMVLAPDPLGEHWSYAGALHWQNKSDSDQLLAS